MGPDYITQLLTIVASIQLLPHITAGLPHYIVLFDSTYIPDYLHCQFLVETNYITACCPITLLGPGHYMK